MLLLPAPVPERVLPCPGAVEAGDRGPEEGLRARRVAARPEVAPGMAPRGGRQDGGREASARERPAGLPESPRRPGLPRFGLRGGGRLEEGASRSSIEASPCTRGTTSSSTTGASWRPPPGTWRRRRGPSGGRWSSTRTSPPLGWSWGASSRSGGTTRRPSLSSRRRCGSSAAAPLSTSSSPPPTRGRGGPATPSPRTAGPSGAGRTSRARTRSSGWPRFSPCRGSLPAGNSTG